MTTAVQTTGGAGTVGGGSSSDLADVIDTILDKGLVIDAHVAVGVVGIRLLTIDARVVVASVDTYLRFAEAVNRLDLTQVGNAQTLGDLTGNGRSDRRRSTGSDSRDERGSAELTEGHRNGDEAEPPGDEREPEHAGDGGSDEEGGGLLSRLKQRGQAFQ